MIQIDLGVKALVASAVAIVIHLITDLDALITQEAGAKLAAIGIITVSGGVRRHLGRVVRGEDGGQNTAGPFGHSCAPRRTARQALGWPPRRIPRVLAVYRWPLPGHSGRVFCEGYRGRSRRALREK